MKSQPNNSGLFCLLEEVGGQMGVGLGSRDGMGEEGVEVGCTWSMELWKWRENAFIHGNDLG